MTAILTTSAVLRPMLIGTFLVALLATISASSNADVGTDSSSSYKYTESKLVDTVQPRYPRSELNRGQEGWVVLSFIVDQQGKVIDPIIDDSTGNKQFEKSALKAVKKFGYVAASLNGKPIQQCHSKVKISFAIRGGSSGASKAFFRKYKTISRNINARKFDQAKTAMAELSRKPKWNLYEDAWYWYLQSQVLLATAPSDDKPGYIEALRKAIAYDGKHLKPAVYRESLKRLYYETINKHLFREAFKTSQELSQYRNRDSKIATLVGHSAELKATLDSSSHFSVAGKIVDGKPWQHDLYRREFSITTERGKLDSVEIRCDKKRRRFDIVDDQTLKIPDSWGECAIYVDGSDDSRFSLHEFSPISTAAL